MMLFSFNAFSFQELKFIECVFFFLFFWGKPYPAFLMFYLVVTLMMVQLVNDPWLLFIFKVDRSLTNLSLWQQVMKNMGEILKAGGADYSSVVKTTIMYEFFCHFLLPCLILWSQDLDKEDVSLIVLPCRLADLGDFQKVNEIYGKCKYYGSEVKILICWLIAFGM